MKDIFCCPLVCSCGRLAKSSIKFLAFAKAKTEQFYLRMQQKTSFILA